MRCFRWVCGKKKGKTCDVPPLFRRMVLVCEALRCAFFCFFSFSIMTISPFFPFSPQATVASSSLKTSSFSMVFWSMSSVLFASLLSTMKWGAGCSSSSYYGFVGRINTAFWRVIRGFVCLYVLLFLKNVWRFGNNTYFCTRVSPTRHAPSESPRT